MAEITPEMIAALKQIAQSNIIANPVIKPGYGKTIPMPRKEFPDYEYHPYPKMMHEEFTKEYLDFWRGKNSYLDAGSGKVCYSSAAPKIGSNQPLRATEDDVERGYAKAIGDPVIVRNAHEEREVLERRGLVAKPAKAKAVQVPIAGDADEIAALRAENARLRSAQGTETQKKKPGRPPKQKQGGTVVVKELPAEV